MSEISSQRKRVLAISEGTYGTDAVDGALQDASADLIYQDLPEVSIAPAREIVEIGRVRGAHSGAAHQTIADVATVTVTGAMTARAGAGAGAEAPYWSAFLLAANMQETVVSDTSATYKPVTVQESGMSIYQYERELESTDWRLTYATGVRGSMVFNFALNEEATFSFEGQGIYEGQRSDGAVFFDATTGAAALLKDGSTSSTARTGGAEQYADKTPVICTNMTITGAGTAYPVSDLELDLNWTVAIKRVVTGSTNAVKVLLTRAPQGQRIQGSFTLVDGAAAHDAILDAFEADTELELVVEAYEGGVSTSTTPKITITASQVQLGQPSPGDSEGILTHTIPFFLNGDWSALTDGTDFSMVFDEVS